AVGAAGGVAEAGEAPVRAESRWDRVKDKVPFQHAAVHGPLRGWGFTERSWKKTASGGCELALVPAAGHVPHSDPVNDVFWVGAVDEQGTVVEGQPLFSTRDRAGGQEQYVEPSTRRALQDLAEEKALPKATSAGVKAGVVTGMGTAASVVATDGGQAAATVLATGTGVVAGGTGLLAGWAAHKIVLKRRGEVRDPTAPRTVRFSRSLEEMKDLRVRVWRGDHPRQAREAARTDTLALLERRAREHDISGDKLVKARGRIQDLPGFPRGKQDSTLPDMCQQAVLMHVREGRERLIRNLLELDDRNGKG
ncbi:MAG: hypothetical protein QG608_1364, partial [Actinomycetota bacterium]|nr:hypothetical protein [Actinomycetota bacterium]